MGSLASIVIPAHNEAAVIGRCLAALSVGVPAGALETVVVCNGCSDRTADVARGAGVAVLETSHRGKSTALNLGDEAVRTFPRFYVDADVEVTGAALAAVASVLRTGGTFAAAPRLLLDRRGLSVASRAYHAIWVRLPYVRENHIGSGVVGLSEDGRRRFDRFPDAIADDFFLYHLFGPGERRAVDGVSFTVRPTRTVAELVRRKSRVHAGNAEMRELGLAPRRASAPRRLAWLGVVLTHPWLLPCAPVYAGVSVVSTLRARQKVRGGQLKVWERDDGSRGIARV